MTLISACRSANQPLIIAALSPTFSFIVASTSRIKISLDFK